MSDEIEFSDFSDRKKRSTAKHEETDFADFAAMDLLKKENIEKLNIDFDSDFDSLDLDIPNLDALDLDSIDLDLDLSDIGLDSIDFDDFGIGLDSIDLDGIDFVKSIEELSRAGEESIDSFNLDSFDFDDFDRSIKKKA